MHKSKKIKRENRKKKYVNKNYSNYFLMLRKCEQLNYSPFYNFFYILMPKFGKILKKMVKMQFYIKTFERLK